MFVLKEEHTRMFVPVGFAVYSTVRTSITGQLLSVLPTSASDMCCQTVKH